MLVLMVAGVIQFLIFPFFVIKDSPFSSYYYTAYFGKLVQSL